MLKIEDTSLITIYFKSGRILRCRISDDWDDEDGFQNSYNHISNGKEKDRTLVLEFYEFKSDDKFESYMCWINFDSIECIDLF
jgi:hypothetical protein